MYYNVYVFMYKPLDFLLVLSVNSRVEFGAVILSAVT